MCDHPASLFLMLAVQLSWKPLSEPIFLIPPTYGVLRLFQAKGCPAGEFGQGLCMAWESPCHAQARGQQTPADVGPANLFNRDHSLVLGWGC